MLPIKHVSHVYTDDAPTTRLIFSRSHNTKVLHHFR